MGPTSTRRKDWGNAEEAIVVWASDIFNKGDGMGYWKARVGLNG